MYNTPPAVNIAFLTTNNPANTYADTTFLAAPGVGKFYRIAAWHACFRAPYTASTKAELVLADTGFNAFLWATVISDTSDMWGGIVFPEPGLPAINLNQGIKVTSYCNIASQNIWICLLYFIDDF